MQTITPMTQAYLTCALWSSTDENGEPLDSVFSLDDLSAEALNDAQTDCALFVTDAQRAGLDLSQLSEDQIGHDLWLTRNGHGAGFWYRGLGALGESLSDIARRMGGVDAYAGDNGQVYFQ